MDEDLTALWRCTLWRGLKGGDPGVGANPARCPYDLAERLSAADVRVQDVALEKRASAPCWQKPTDWRKGKAGPQRSMVTPAMAPKTPNPASIPARALEGSEK